MNVKPDANAGTLDAAVAKLCGADHAEKIDEIHSISTREATNHEKAIYRENL